MLLQLLNRAQPRFQHLARLGQLHPERLYDTMHEIACELVTFTDESRLPPNVQPMTTTTLSVRFVR